MSQDKIFVAKKTLTILIRSIIPIILFTWAGVTLAISFAYAEKRNYIFLAVMIMDFALVIYLLVKVILYLRGGLVAISADDKGVYFFAKKEIFIPYSQIKRCEYSHSRSEKTRMPYGVIYLTTDETTYKIPFVKNVSSSYTSLAALIEHDKIECEGSADNDPSSLA